MSRTFALAFLAVASALAFAACGGGSDSAAPAGTGTTLAACDAVPALTGLTYADDVKPIVDAACIGCHDGTPGDAPVPGVPPGTDFRTREGILLHAPHVDELAGANPAGTVVRTTMPPFGFGSLTTAQRQVLSCWLVTPGQP